MHLHSGTISWLPLPPYEYKETIIKSRVLLKFNLFKLKFGARKDMTKLKKVWRWMRIWDPLKAFIV